MSWEVAMFIGTVWGMLLGFVLSTLPGARCGVPGCAGRDLRPCAACDGRFCPDHLKTLAGGVRVCVGCHDHRGRRDREREDYRARMRHLQEAIA